MEHMQHHHPNSPLLNWLFLLLALMIELPYRTRYLRRGAHPVLIAIQIRDTVRSNLRPAHANTS